jgi:hypothetical protein
MKTRGAYAGNDNNLVRLNTYCLSGQNEMLDVNDKRFLKSGFKKKKDFTYLSNVNKK